MPAEQSTPMPPAPAVVVSGPSGSGKSKIIERLLAEKTWPLRLSVSVTTRQPRPNEKDGVHYYFWTRTQFEEKRAADGFLEWAEVFGNYYGTLRGEVEPYRRQGIGVLLDIDVQGWQQVKQRCPDVVSVFIRTASLATYEKRLRERGTESEESLQRRLRGAEAELAFAPRYDHQVINEDLGTALTSMRAILKDAFERQNDAR